jgi:copper chaperone CopZ
MAENKMVERAAFVVEGMHCSSCALAIEKGLKRRIGIVY